MRIPLRADWEFKIIVFDKLQAQGRLEYTTQPTPFCFSVFMVYKTLFDDSNHGRSIIDIRRLNQISI